MDIVYIIDANGSMGYEIEDVNKYVFTVFKELKDKYKENNFQYGSVLIRIKYILKNIKIQIKMNITL